MRLVYNNIIEPKYQYHTDSDENDTTIGSPTLPTTDLTPITLYDSDPSEDKSPIYIDFAKAETLDQIITFCNKYGAIINFKLVPKNDNEYHNYQTLQIFECYNDLYDCISYKHFKYYQLQMKYLIEIHRLMLKYNTLKDKSYTNSKDIDNTLKDLLLNCLALIQNPFFSVMYELEYADTTDHEKYRTYFSKYPFIDYIYRLNISKSKHITSQIDDITEAKSATNVDDNSGIKKDDNINTTTDNNAESKTDNNSNSITDIKTDFYSDLIENNGTPASMASTTGSVMTSPLLPSVLPPPLPELEAFRLTMTVTEADAVPLETTMEVAPVPTAVMTPLALTVATLVSLDLKVRDWEAEDGVTLPVMHDSSYGGTYGSADNGICS